MTKRIKILCNDFMFPLLENNFTSQLSCRLLLNVEVKRIVYHPRVSGVDYSKRAIRLKYGACKPLEIKEMGKTLSCWQFYAERKFYFH